MFPPFYDSNIDIIRSNPRLSNSSDMDNQTFESSQMGRKSMEIGSPPEFLAISQENDRTSWSSQSAVRTWNHLTRQIIQEAYFIHPWKMFMFITYYLVWLMNRLFIYFTELIAKFHYN